MAASYRNMKLALYCTASCLNADMEQLAREMDFFQKHLKVSKVYIENHRGDVTLSEDRLRELKRFFESRGIETAGGITPTLGEAYRPGYERHFGAICYTEEASRQKIKEAAVTAARVFDELILDDFFFTNCACDTCLERKGNRTWETFRLELMEEVSRNLIVKPAKAANPKVKTVIKYPNWNEAYPATGYHTEKQPEVFDGIYTGTETRDPATSQQHIPRYASYSLLRWMENAYPGRNGGGWFDSLDCTYIDYYLEQAYLTVFGQAKELTLFCYSLLKDSVYIPPLGFQLEKLDELARRLRKPEGIRVYLPHRGRGEDHLADYLGMLGLPMEPTPHFPEGPQDTGGAALLMTEASACDPEAAAKLSAFLKLGGTAVMTSGFVAAMQGRGAEEWTTLRPTGRHMAVSRFAVETDVCTFETFAYAAEPVVYPVFDYSTNGTWQQVVAWNGQNNIPVLMADHYGKGRLFTLIIPDNFADLTRLPAEVLNRVRRTLTGSLLPYRLEGPGSVGLFAYEGGTLVLESFSPVPASWTLRLPAGKRLMDLATGRTVPRQAVDESGEGVYGLRLNPSAFRTLRIVE